MAALDRLQSGLFFTQTSIPAPDLNIQHAKRVAPLPQAQPAVNYRHAPPSTNNQPPPEVALPLLSVSVDVDIHERLCMTKVTQQFSNASSSTVQNAKYVFPIYDGSVVSSFRCWIGNDKLLEGAVMAKEAARTDFQHAISEHKAAVLVEELAPEVFETNVGNIPAQTTIKIEIAYVSLLKVDNSTGGLVLTIPTSIAPRYGNPPQGYSPNLLLLTEGLRINV